MVEEVVEEAAEAAEAEAVELPEEAVVEKAMHRPHSLEMVRRPAKAAHFDAHPSSRQSSRQLRKVAMTQQAKRRRRPMTLVTIVPNSCLVTDAAAVVVVVGAGSAGFYREASAMHAAVASIHPTAIDR